MSLTFLDALNATLRRVLVIQGATGELTSLTDSAIQPDIDLMIQFWNETLQNIYTESSTPLPIGTGEDSITLVTGQREYNLPFLLEEIIFPLLNEDDGNFIYRYPGGYEAMRIAQPQPDNFEGRPLWAVINPTNSLLRFDTTPTAQDAGEIYKIIFKKTLGLVDATDLFPCSDQAVQSMFAPVADNWRRWKNQDVDEKQARKNYAKAIGLITKKTPRKRY